MLGPAVPLGHLDRLGAALHGHRQRPVGRGARPLRQAGDLDKRPPYPVRQGDALLEVVVGLAEPLRHQLRGAEADERHRPRVLATAGLGRVRRSRQREQLLSFFYNGWDVVALAGKPEPLTGNQHAENAAPVLGHRRRQGRGALQMPLGVL